MTLREELDKMKREMDEEEVFRAENDVHPAPNCLPRDCRMAEADEVGEAGKNRRGPEPHE